MVWGGKLTGWPRSGRSSEEGPEGSVRPTADAIAFPQLLNEPVAVAGIQARRELVCGVKMYMVRVGVVGGKWESVSR